MPKIEELKHRCIVEITMNDESDPINAMAKITLAAMEETERYKKDENGLLPCPFCGGDNVSFHCERLGRWVHCDDCQAYGGTPQTDYREQREIQKAKAADAWNTRAHNAAVRAVLDVTGGGE